MLRYFLTAVFVTSFLPATAFAADDESDDVAEDVGDDATSDDAKADEGSDDDADKADGNDPRDKNGDGEISDAERLGKWHVLDFMTFGVGLVGNLGGNFLDKPAAADQTIGGVDYQNAAAYPGFAGFTSGIGPLIELRFFGYVGIEWNFLFQSDAGSAELEHTDLNSGAKAVFDIEIKQSAVHIPMLFKGALPGEWVTPVLFVGPEFVIAGDAECGGPCSSPPGAPPTYAAQSEDYVAVAFGLGIEILLPVLPLVDIRFPFQLRGNFSPGAGSTREDRATHDVNGATLNREVFDTAWQFQAAATFGAAWHF